MHLWLVNLCRDRAAKPCSRIAPLIAGPAQVVLEAVQTCRSPQRLLQCGGCGITASLPRANRGFRSAHHLFSTHIQDAGARGAAYFSCEASLAAAQDALRWANQSGNSWGGGCGCVEAVSVLNFKSAVVMSGSENMGQCLKLTAGRAMPLSCTSALDRAEGDAQVETPGLRNRLWCTWGQAGSEEVQMSNQQMAWSGRCSPPRAGDNRQVQACGGKNPGAGATQLLQTVVWGLGTA